MRLQLNHRRQRFETLSTKLTQLDPRLVLSRGYAIVLNQRDAIVREAADAPAGTDVKILLEKDALEARVTGSHPEERH
jgi:exodeoxyribonuclease VII large subunit